MSQQRLDKLLRAIHNAVLKAQEITEEQHIHQLDKYFDETGKPIVQELEVPSLRPDAEPETTEIIRVPLLALLPPTAIKIKKLKVRFETALQAFDTPGENDGNNDGFLTADTTKPVTPANNASQAKIEIMFVGTDPAESFLRINDHLIKSIL